ncbi:hypothetical protein RQP46_001339 [Phenoliferia psychrophenolica]
MRQPRGVFLFLLLSLVSLLALSPQLANADSTRSGSGSGSGSTNNWAVLVCSSRFWFNYRHMANTLAMYRTVKRLGIPDSQIILMLADDVACNPRNPFAGTVYSNADRKTDLYGETIEVDYKGEEVNVESFLRVLSGRMPDSTPPSKRLMTDSRSNIFVYMTGHGGDEFLKFQDNEEISAFDIADAFGGMWAKGRYNEILFMVDTCQANTLYTKFYSPNIIATGSSAKGENSYSHHADNDIGVAVTDRYTHHVLTFLESINKTSTVTLQNLTKQFDTFNHQLFDSNAGVRSDLFPRPLDEVLLTDFFGGVAQHRRALLAIPIFAAVLQTALFVGSIYVTLNPWIMPDSGYLSYSTSDWQPQKKITVFVSIVGAGISAISGLALAMGAKCFIGQRLAASGISLENYATIRQVGESRLPSKASMYAFAPVALFLLSNSAAPAIISIWQASAGRSSLTLETNFASFAEQYDFRTVLVDHPYYVLSYTSCSDPSSILTTNVTSTEDGAVRVRVEDQRHCPSTTWDLIYSGSEIMSSMISCMNNGKSYAGYFFINATDPAAPVFVPLASCLTTVTAGTKSGVIYRDGSSPKYYIPELYDYNWDETILIQQLKHRADATALSQSLVAQMWGDQSLGGHGYTALNKLVKGSDSEWTREWTLGVLQGVTRSMAAMAIQLSCLKVGPSGWETLYLGVVAAMWLAVLLALAVSLRNPPVSLDPLDPISMLLVAQNSPPSSELEGGCTGDVDRLHSRKVKMRLRAVDSDHLGFVYGDERELAALPSPVIGRSYGRLSRRSSTTSFASTV